MRDLVLVSLAPTVASKGEVAGEEAEETRREFGVFVSICDKGDKPQSSLGLLLKRVKKLE